MATFRTSRGALAADASWPHVVLLGLPGAGKSTVGRLAASQASRPFLDFDQEIERRQGQTVAEIFAERGEAVFRQLEHELTEEVVDLGGMILAPGAGWVTNPQNLALLRGRAHFVWLKVRPEAAMARLSGDSSVRPLLVHPDPLGELRGLLQARQALYELAKHRIDTERASVQEAADRVAALATAGRSV